MKNYICLNGKKTYLTEEQVASILDCNVNIENKRLSEIPVNGTFKIGQYEFIVLHHSKETTKVILKSTLGDEPFGSSNNYAGSKADEVCVEFAQELEKIVGNNNVIQFTVNLTSDDGLKDYGTIQRKAALLTANECRKYVSILDTHKLNEYWWTATAYSTPTHSNSVWVKCVSPSGGIDFNYCNNYGGVRPSCILKSNIFVSE